MLQGPRSSNPLAILREGLKLAPPEQQVGEPLGDPGDRVQRRCGIAAPLGAVLGHHGAEHVVIGKRQDRQG